MNARRAILISALCAVILIGFALILYFNLYLLEYREIGMEMTLIEGGVGFNTDTDMFHFGHLNPGGLSRRTLTVTPIRDSRLVIRLSGNASDFVVVDKNDLVVEAGVPLNITFWAQPPKEQQLGHYEGVARFSFYRP